MRTANEGGGGGGDIGEREWEWLLGRGWVRVGVGLGEGWVRVGVWVRKWVGGKVTGGWRLEKEKMASKGGWRGLEPA